MLLDTEAAELDGRDPQVLPETLLAARLRLIGDAQVEGVEPPHACLPAMKSCCSNFSRESLASFSACLFGSLHGGCMAAFMDILLEADVGRELEKLMLPELPRPWPAELGRESGRDTTIGGVSNDSNVWTDIFDG